MYRSFVLVAITQLVAASRVNTKGKVRSIFDSLRPKSGDRFAVSQSRGVGNLESETPRLLHLGAVN